LVNIRAYDDSEFYKKIFHFSLKDSPIPSMAVSLINGILPVKDRVARIIDEADEILREWGVQVEYLNSS